MKLKKLGSWWYESEKKKNGELVVSKRGIFGLICGRFWLSCHRFGISCVRFGLSLSGSGEVEIYSG